MNDFDTDMTSDILIYNILQNTDDEFIKKCNIKFIDKSVPALEDDTIYVANVDLENNMKTYEGTEYIALVNIYVKTKDTDYIGGSRFLRTVIKHIKHVLKSNQTCKLRHIKFRNIRYEYGSGYTLRGLHLFVQLLEMENDSLDEYSCVNIDSDDLKIDFE